MQVINYIRFGRTHVMQSKNDTLFYVSWFNYQEVLSKEKHADWFDVEGTIGNSILVAFKVKQPVTPSKN